MAIQTLAQFIGEHRDEIIHRCKAKAATRLSPRFQAAAVNHGVPLFLDQLVDTLERGAVGNLQISESALLHGRDLLRQGMSVSDVVRSYGDVCQTITSMAMESGASLGANDFRTLNGCLDDAIASGVTEFAREEGATRDAEMALADQRRTYATRELRNLTNTAIAAFEALRNGDVSVGGSTAALLWRSLQETRAILVPPLSTKTRRNSSHAAPFDSMPDG